MPNALIKDVAEFSINIDCRLSKTSLATVGLNVAKIQSSKAKATNAAYLIAV